MSNKENEIACKTAQFKRVISAQAEVWEGSNGTVSEIKSKFDTKTKAIDAKITPLASKATPTKNKVAEIHKKIATNVSRSEVNSTPTRSINIPANKVTEMKQKISEVGEKSKAGNFTPTRSINIPMNKVNEIRRLLASLEKGARENHEGTLSSKKRAVIDARMNTVSDIMKWIEDLSKNNQKNNHVLSKRGIDLPVNRVNEMKDWLVDFERQNKEHFKDGPKKGVVKSESTSAAKRAKSDVGGAHEDNVNKDGDVKPFNGSKQELIDETTHTDVLKMIALLNELDRQNRSTKHEEKNVGKNRFRTANNGTNNHNAVDQVKESIERENDVDDANIQEPILDHVGTTQPEEPQVVQHDNEYDTDFQLEEQLDVDISMLPRPSEDSFGEESEDWEDVFAELSSSSDEELEDDYEEEAEDTEVRKLIDSFIHCDDSKESAVEESSTHLDYSDHDSQEHSNSNAHVDEEKHLVSSDSVRKCDTSVNQLISPVSNFEVDFDQAFLNSKLTVNTQAVSEESHQFIIQVSSKEAVSPLMPESENAGLYFESNVGQTKSFVPWRAHKKIVIDTKSSQVNKKGKNKKFGNKLLKLLKRMISRSGYYESERNKVQPIPLARTLSESEAASSAISPLSRLSDDILTPRAPQMNENKVVSYLPSAYTCRKENMADIVPFKGPLTPDQSLASAFDNQLSPDSSKGSSASDYALVLAKSVNVTQHVQFMRGVFGSPTQRLPNKSGVAIGQLSLVASSGAI